MLGMLWYDSEVGIDFMYSGGVQLSGSTELGLLPVEDEQWWCEDRPATSSYVDRRLSTSLLHISFEAPEKQTGMWEKSQPGWN